jgi:hypothetical protein
MKHVRIHPRGWLAGSVGAVAIAGTMGLMTIGTGASASLAGHHATHRPARPDAHVRAAQNADTSDPVVAFVQRFRHNDSQFCPTSAGNPPCDGNGGAGDYGTIDRVLGGFSNGGYGNYAPSTPALTGSQGWMALVSGTQDINQGTGCPGTAVEECTGPYAFFGDGGENVFPGSGFTVTDDLYLSPGAGAQNGSLIDDDVEINNPSGTFGIDNIITACPEGSQFSINFGHNSPGSCATPGVGTVTTAGWYRFVFVFSNVAGNAYLTMNVVSEANPTSIIATSMPQPVGGGAAESITAWGGPGYFWLPTEDISGVPLDNFALQLGQHPHGNTP